MTDVWYVVFAVVHNYTSALYVEIAFAKTFYRLVWPAYAAVEFAKSVSIRFLALL